MGKDAEEVMKKNDMDYLKGVGRKDSLP